MLVVVNKHNTARVASCWFIIYYRLVMQHGNSNINSTLEEAMKARGVEEYRQIYSFFNLVAR